MLKLKKLMIIGGIVMAVATTSLTTFAVAAYTSPAEAVAGITGKTVESVIAEKKDTGVTYGTIAKNAGKLDEFKKEMLQIKTDRLTAKVKAGTMTQAKADEIIKAIKENQAKCDGTGSAKIGQKMGAGFGNGNGSGNGQGKGQGNGLGQGNGGQGRGQGNCDGTCQAK